MMNQDQNDTDHRRYTDIFCSGISLRNDGCITDIVSIVNDANGYTVSNIRDAIPPVMISVRMKITDDRSARSIPRIT